MESSFARDSPWYPRIFAAPKTLLTYVSSPKPSTTRPHLGSRDTSTIGENVQFTPPEAASLAEMRASVSATAGSKLAACARGTGNVVRWPCTTSSPTRRGTPCGVSSRAVRWSSLVASALRGQKTAPIPPLARSLASSSRGRKAIWSWASFCSQVIAARSSSMNASAVSLRGSCPAVRVAKCCSSKGGVRSGARRFAVC